MSKIEKSFIHNGPVFPKPYQYKGIYKVNDVILPEMLENLIWHWANLGEQYRNDKMYVKNAAPTIKKHSPASLSLLRFPEDYMSVMEKMRADNERIKEERKLANTKEAREAKKVESEKIREQYGYCEIDGVKEPMGNYILEPEGWYIGRGQSPIRGLWKYAIRPEDVTINFIPAKDERAPVAPNGHCWKAVIQNKDAYSPVYYDIYLGESGITLHKKFTLGVLSDVKQNADIEKFNKARELVKDWDKIEKWIEDGCRAGKQEALISWLILRTGIRVGGEKAEKFENGTVGASTLLVSNVKINENTLKLHFLGKDSVPFSSELEVPDFIISGILACQKGKAAKDKLFDKANSGTVNDFLQECIPYCSAKLFRTAYGTKVLAEELRKSDTKKGLPEWKVKSIYDNACLAVSKKLNHQKNVAKNFSIQMDKTDENIKKSKEALSRKKDKAAEQIKKIDHDLKVAKKALSGEKLQERINLLKVKKEKIQQQVSKSKDRVSKLEANKDLKKSTKTISLNTAKNAYSSPAIAYSFCKDMGVDISIVYNKTMQAKFSWAEGTPASYWRKYPY